MNERYYGYYGNNDFLEHKKHKYLYKKVVNGKWRYYYEDGTSKDEKEKGPLAKAVEKGAQAVGNLLDTTTTITDKHGKVIYKKTTKGTISKAIEKGANAVSGLFDDTTTYTIPGSGYTAYSKKVTKRGKINKAILKVKGAIRDSKRRNYQSSIAKTKTTQIGVTRMSGNKQR